MYSKKGFTLIEVLIVVAISLSVLIFAVPAYKKTQEKAKFEAAMGTLVNVGTAVNLVREKIIEVHGPNSGIKFPGMSGGDGKIPLQSSLQSGVSSTDETSDYTAPYGAGPGQILDSERIKAMFAQKLIAPIPFDKDASSYKGYFFFLCPEINTSAQGCCPKNAVAVACMSNDSADKAYYSAYFTKMGEVVKVAKD